MENRIDLKFDKLVRDLTGNPFGRKVFNEQVKPSLKNDVLNVIVIPEEINDVGSSFVQGIYFALSEKYGKEKALNIMQIDCVNSFIVDKVRKVIDTYGI